MVVTAQRPEGPYSEPVLFEEDGIDPSLFHDTDGRHYMLLNRGARIFEVDAQATRRLSETTLLYYGSCKRAPEGPHLLKKDGWYYLFLAEGGTGMGHRETVARSRNLHGPYEPSPYGPVLRQWDERALIQRCGHAKPVSTPDGRWYLVYLCGRALEGQWTLLGRETALDPIQWTGGRLAAAQPRPGAQRAAAQTPAGCSRAWVGGLAYAASASAGNGALVWGAVNPAGRGQRSYGSFLPQPAGAAANGLPLQLCGHGDGSAAG